MNHLKFKIQNSRMIVFNFVSILFMSKTVFITGATSGFGKACAEKFAAHGYDLILNGRRKERLAELQTTLQNKFNIAVLLLPFDVQNREEVITAIQNIPEDWQQIDVLINNAGLALGVIILMKQTLTIGIPCLIQM